MQFGVSGRVVALASAALCLGLFLALAPLSEAKKDSAQSLEGKVQQLMDLTAKRPVIRLNGNKFK